MKISLKFHSAKVSCKDNAALAYSLYLITKRNFYRPIGTVQTLFPTVKQGTALLCWAAKRSEAFLWFKPLQASYCYKTKADVLLLGLAFFKCLFLKT